MTNDKNIKLDYPSFLENEDSPCAETFPDAFFPDELPDGAITRRTVYSYEKEAKQICGNCEYKTECFKFAYDRPELIGIWGGTTERERNKIRNNQLAALGLPSRRK